MLCKAKQSYGNIGNFATSLLSNHMHQLLAGLDGDPRKMSDYIGFIKRELTRRWAKQLGFRGTAWQTYVASAVITPDRQIQTLKYLIAQGVKENLVEHPYA